MTTTTHKGKTTAPDEVLDADRGAQAGKVQLRAQLGGKPLQDQLQLLAPGGEGAGVQAVAAQGVSGSGGSLPHLDTIQSSFGRHDVSGVQAHVGGAAADASAAMGASAYAMGNDVGFASSPSLHTAAHEAAHVVQQREGVQLEGGVGRAGDRYEQHADQVADAVVAGKSAEGLLDKMAGPSAAGSRAVQKKDEGDAAPAPAPESQSKGDEMREAVLKSALAWLDSGKEFISQAKIDSVQSGTMKVHLGKVAGMDITVPVPTGKAPVKNFTTCIEFAGQTLRDAAKSVHGKDVDGIVSTMKILPAVMKLYGKEVQLHAEIIGFGKTIKMYDDPDKAAAGKRNPLSDTASKLAHHEAEKAKADAVLADEEASKTDKLRAKAQAKAHAKAVAIFEKHLADIKDKISKFQQKIKDKEQAIALNREENDAMIRPQDGMTTSGRPKAGEYVILCQPPNKSTYGISDIGEDGQQRPRVALAPGAFLHICVLREEPKQVGEDLELWRTIDGGGTKAKAWDRYVQPSTRLVFYRNPLTEKDVAASFQVGGWIDWDKALGGKDKDGEDA